MLGKLTKHEFHATARMILPLYIILVITSIFFSITEHYSLLNYEFLQTGEGHTLLRFITSLSSVFFFVSIISVNAAVFIMMIYRFYKNYMTDEGYLMFTLPVKTGQLIWSKLIVSTIWTLITVLADILAIFIVLFGISSSGGFFFSDIWEEVLAFSSGFSGHVIVWTIEFLLSALFSAWSTYLLFYSAITLGHSFSNHKILWSILFYIAFSSAMQTLVTIMTVIAIPSIYDNAIDTSVSAIYYIVSCILVISIILVAIFYALSHIMLKRKLNLQ